MKGDSELTYKIALSMTKHVNADVVREMASHDIAPEDFFRLETPSLSEALGGGLRFEKMDRDEALFAARKEEELMDRHNVEGYFLLDEDYPLRLQNIPDAPVFFYQLGNTDLDSRHIINVVGTRKPTAYGLDFAGRLVADLAAYFSDLVIVSGMAYGIDAAAHNSSLESNVATIGVMAHGLNMIYPAQHRDLARNILAKGGSLISEYPFGVKPFPSRFLERNRIVAGLTDATIVVESDLKGGAMSTANYAFSYSREVMALPGKISDNLSRGCNALIRREKAHLITCAADVCEFLGWKPLGVTVNSNTRNLFPEIEGDEKIVYDVLRTSGSPLLVDQIFQISRIPVSSLMSLLGEMEFDGIVIRHPGNRYTIA